MNLRKKSNFLHLVLTTIGIFIFQLSVFAQIPVANFSTDVQSGCSPLVVKFTDQSSGNPTKWLWDFGNGKTSLVRSPTVSYTAAGTYSVSLIVTNNSGSSIRRQQTITVHPNPESKFSLSKTVACVGESVAFTDESISVSSITAYHWDFGDGSTSTEQNPMHHYTVAGNFTVSLRVLTSNGCYSENISQQRITVHPTVDVNFTPSGYYFCSAPAAVTFNNTSVGATAYIWDFGNGDTRTQTSPTYTFNSNGIYKVRLTARNNNCSESKEVTIAIGQAPMDFNSPAEICMNEAFAVTNLSDPEGNTWRWNMGDGGPLLTTKDIASYTYTSGGNRTITLTGRYNGCDFSFSKSIFVKAAPTVNFEAAEARSCIAPFSVSFTDLTPENNTIAWRWDFGNGTTSTEQNPVVVYNQLRNYNVSLSVTNSDGCSAVRTMNNYIRIATPVINSITAPNGICVGETLRPTASVSVVDGIRSRLWSAGNGQTSTAANPSFTYNVQGTYTLSLTVITNTGCEVAATKEIKVGDIPVVDFEAVPIPVCAGQTVQFTDLTDKATSWNWTFGDTARNNSTEQHPVKIYNGPGQYNVTLSANNNGCIRELTKPAFITVNPPEARFTVERNCNTPNSFHFTDASIGATAWQWNFGDGNTSSLQSPTHVYAAPGNYTVTLTATNGQCSFSLQKRVYLPSPPPDFSVSTIEVCKNQTISFSTENIFPEVYTKIVWNFGDGTIMDGTNLTGIEHRYATAGVYAVQMTVTDIYGCDTTIEKANIVHVNGPTAALSINNGSGCIDLNASFTDQSVPYNNRQITSWIYDFGDGTSQSFTTAPATRTHNYPEAGLYTIKLTITDEIGCTDILEMKDVIKTSNPIPDFNVDATVACPAATLNFTDGSSSALPYTTTWFFGDGNSANVQHPAYNYATEGVYDVRLQIIDQYGCQRDTVKEGYINTHSPVADFSINVNETGCSPVELSFTNASTNATSYRWVFGTGGVSTLENPAHTFNLPGSYNIQLTASNHPSCISTATHPLLVKDKNLSTIAVTGVTDCNPTQATFAFNTDINYTALYWDFGDGNVSENAGTTATHSYPIYGNFVPGVILEDPAGCNIYIESKDTVKILGAVVNFQMDRQEFCEEATVQFSDQTTTNDVLVGWLWDFGDGNTSSVQHPVHTYSSPGTYNVSLRTQTQSGCSNVNPSPVANEYAVMVYGAPQVQIEAPAVICLNNTAKLEGIVLQPDIHGLDWSWSWNFSTGEVKRAQHTVSPLFPVAGDQVINLSVMSEKGCSTSVSANVFVNDIPRGSLPDTIITRLGEARQIPAIYPDDVVSWKWTPARDLSCTDCPQPDANPKAPTVYTVVYNDENGCANSGTIRVMPLCNNLNLFIPNTFSPNGDGSNDIFFPRGTGVNNIQALRIINRWGQVVFEKRNFPANNATYGWNGRVNGQAPQAGVYIYQIEVICENGDILKYEGDIALIL